jgi:hypothetical protein
MISIFFLTEIFVQLVIFWGNGWNSTWASYLMYYYSTDMNRNYIICIIGTQYQISWKFVQYFQRWNMTTDERTDTISLSFIHSFIHFTSSKQRALNLRAFLHLHQLIICDVHSTFTSLHWLTPRCRIVVKVIQSRNSSPFMEQEGSQQRTISPYSELDEFNPQPPPCFF